MVVENTLYARALNIGGAVLLLWAMLVGGCSDDGWTPEMRKEYEAKRKMVEDQELKARHQYVEEQRALEREERAKKVAAAAEAAAHAQRIAQMTAAERAKGASDALTARQLSLNPKDSFALAHSYLDGISKADAARPDVRRALAQLTSAEEKALKDEQRAIAAKEKHCTAGRSTRERWLVTAKNHEDGSPMDNGFRFQGPCSEWLYTRDFSCDEEAVRNVYGRSPWLAEAASVGFEMLVCETVVGGAPSGNIARYSISRFL